MLFTRYAAADLQLEVGRGDYQVSEYRKLSPGGAHWGHFKSVDCPLYMEALPLGGCFVMQEVSSRQGIMRRHTKGGMIYVGRVAAHAAGIGLSQVAPPGEWDRNCCDFHPRGWILYFQTGFLVNNSQSLSRSLPLLSDCGFFSKE